MDDLNKINDPNTFLAWMSKQLRSHDDIPLSFGERLDWDQLIPKWDDAIDAAKRIMKVRQPVVAADYVSPLQMEARLCVWEELCQKRLYVAPGQDGLNPGMSKLWDDYGSVTMRLSITPIMADFALKVYDAPDVKQAVEGRWSYDWEYIPFIVGMFTESNGEHLILPDFELAVANVLAAIAKEYSTMGDDDEDGPIVHGP
jgi:hypothetical protein